MDKQELDRVISSLKEGNVVAIPTETVYGLAASIFNETGLRKIFSVKNRPFFDPLIVHVSNIEMAKSVAKRWSPIAQFLANRFWPGPLTMVLPKAEQVNSLITSGLGSVGIRMPSHPIALQVIEALGHPVAAPSANQFGKTSPTSAQHVKNSFPSHDFIILDGGESLVGIESTVVSISEEEKWVKILRPGQISLSKLKKEILLFDSSYRLEKSNKGASPGLLENHYQPDVPLVFVKKNSPITKEDGQKIQESLKLQSAANSKELVLPEDPIFAARELYGRLRKLAYYNPSYIIFYWKEYMKDESWDGILDRLEKASTLKI